MAENENLDKVDRVVDSVNKMAWTIGGIATAIAVVFPLLLKLINLI